MEKKNRFTFLLFVASQYSVRAIRAPRYSTNKNVPALLLDASRARIDSISMDADTQI